MLKDNNLGNEAGVEILKSLKYNNSIAILNLEATMLSNITDPEVQEALCANDRLQVLWLPNNNLGLGTGRVISAALKVNRILRNINL